MRLNTTAQRHKTVVDRKVGIGVQKLLQVAWINGGLRSGNLSGLVISLVHLVLQRHFKVIKRLRNPCAASIERILIEPQRSTRSLNNALSKILQGSALVCEGVSVKLAHRRIHFARLEFVSSRKTISSD